MKDILQIITNHKKKEVEKLKTLVPLVKLKDSIYYGSSTVSLQKYLKRSDKSGVIAEFKRKSPSKPNINLYADPEAISMGYMQSGASALSILTDNHFFGGKSEDLTTARKYNYCPILRKDFIVDAYQIHEAKSIGADAILLISEILTKDEIEEFSALAHDLNLEVLLELHNDSQIHKIGKHIDVVGVNNRDLDTFSTDIQCSIDLYNQLPEDLCKISESGIHTVEQMVKLHDRGYDGFLIGERFMASPDPVQACFQLVQEYQSKLENQ